MIEVNGEPHYTRAEIVEAVREEVRGTGRGAFRPDELPGIAGDAVTHLHEEIARSKDRFTTGG